MDDFQRRATEQGQQFDEQCRLMLKAVGFKDVSSRPFQVRDIGIEIDAQGVTSTGVPLWFEFKGSWFGRRPGLIRTDTVKKALADALLVYLADQPYPAVVILTSHLPDPGSSGARMLNVATSSGALLDVICLNHPPDMDRLSQLAAE